MVQQEKQKDREAGTIEIDKSYDLALQRDREFKERGKKGKKLIKGKEIPIRLNRNSWAQHYATPHISGNCLESLLLFVHEVRTHGGRHRHQGGYNLFILKGNGYTVVDGVKFDWSEGDLILLPFKPGGVEHQHFNIDDKPSRFLAISSLPIADLVGPFMEQKENITYWKEDMFTISR